jgi:membrane associated rhomboid family serine protease
MCLAPINTDAPLYHWPRATVGIIAACCLVFLITTSGLVFTPEQVLNRLGLVHGDGLRPVQWVTSNLLHGSGSTGFVHLAGNMLFLWGFGLVIEGKIGWKAFLAVFFGLGAVECAVEQGIARDTQLVSYGASAIVFGLMALALVWAPRNDFEVGYWAPGFGVGTFDMPIWSFALFAVGVQSVLAAVAGLTWSGAALHLLGAGLGFVLGAVMVNRGWVDCEGWDLFSILRGEHRRNVASDMYIPVSELPRGDGAPGGNGSGTRKKTADPERGAVRRKARCINRVRALLRKGRPSDALVELREARHVLVGWHLPSRDLLDLAEALYNAGLSSDAVGLWEEYIDLHPADADPIRLQAAEVALARERRPHAALRIIGPITAGSLHPRLEARRREIEERACELIDQGVIELQG